MSPIARAHVSDRSWGQPRPSVVIHAETVTSPALKRSRLALEKPRTTALKLSRHTSYRPIGLPVAQRPVVGTAGCEHMRRGGHCAPSRGTSRRYDSPRTPEPRSPDGQGAWGSWDPRVPVSACWSGSGPRPPRATGVSGPSRPRRCQGRAEGRASTHERAAALDAGAGKGWEPVQQANGRGRMVQVSIQPAKRGGRSWPVEARPARSRTGVRPR